MTSMAGIADIAAREESGIFTLIAFVRGAGDDLEPCDFFLDRKLPSVVSMSKEGKGSSDLE